MDIIDLKSLLDHLPYSQIGSYFIFVSCVFIAIFVSDSVQCLEQMPSLRPTPELRQLCCLEPDDAELRRRLPSGVLHQEDEVNKTMGEDLKVRMELGHILITVA